MIGSSPVSRSFFIIGLVLLVASCGGGSGSGGSSGDSFPTPTVPAGARTITAMNADDTAQSATLFASILNEFTQLKTESPPTMAQVVDRVIDQVIRRNRLSRSPNASKTEDLSSMFCDSGSASADFDETSTSESGTITFTNCDIGSGIVIDGELVYDSNWNDTTLDYDIQVGGTLDFDFGAPPIVTIAINIIESGNDGTASFSTNINFSLAGIPDGGYLVTTTQNLVGNAGLLVSGQLIVTGSANSRLRLTIIGPSSASVDLDTGNGTFVSCAAIMGCAATVDF